MKLRVNGELRGTPRVRVIDAKGEPLGEMALSEALRRALKEGLDLVEVNPSADPPVCKLLHPKDYRYETMRSAHAHAAATARTGSHGARRSPSPPPTWTPFECDGESFEFASLATRMQDRPRDWPSHLASPEPWVPIVMLEIRRRSDQDDANATEEAPFFGMIYPEGTDVSVAHAIAAVRRYREQRPRD